MSRISGLTQFAVRFRRTALEGAVLCALLGCSDGMRAIVEPEPNQHARLQGTVLIDGVPRAGVDVWNATPALSGLFGAATVSDADGRFELLVRRSAPDQHEAISMELRVFARPPVVATRIDHSSVVTITFAPLGQPAPVTVLGTPIELRTQAASGTATGMVP